MDPLTVLFKTNPDRRTQIGAIMLDAVTEDSHEYTAQVTSHPIENGGFVSDHVFEEPRRVSITGEITESPVILFSAFNGLTDRRVEAYDQLLALFKSRDVVSVVTGLKVYNDMVMNRFSIPRNQGTGRRLQFTAEFTEIRKAESQIVGVAERKAAPEVADKVSENKDVGKQEPQVPSEPVKAKIEAQQKSISAAGVDFLTGMFQ